MSDPPKYTKEQLDVLFSKPFVPRSKIKPQPQKQLPSPPPGPEPEQEPEQEPEEESEEESEEEYSDEPFEVFDPVMDFEINYPLDKMPLSTSVCTFWLRDECRMVNCAFIHRFYGVRCANYVDGSPYSCFNGLKCPFVHKSIADQRYRWRRYLGREIGIPKEFADEIEETYGIDLEEYYSSLRYDDLYDDDDFDGEPFTHLDDRREYPELDQEPTEDSDYDASDDRFEEDEDDTEIIEDDEDFAADIRVETFADKYKLTELQKKFNWVPPAVVETVFIQNNKMSSNTEDFLNAAYPMPEFYESYTTKPATQEEMEGKVKSVPAKPFRFTNVDSVRRQLPKGVGGDVGNHQDWVSTGSSVNKMFETLRSEACMHARMRNMHFRMATEAYNKGNGKLAKQHSLMGKEHDALMRSLNEQAAKASFEIRNPHFSEMQIGSHTENVIDLHGLYVDEALNILQGLMVNTLSPYDRMFFIIVGVGHHSKDGIPKLQKAVIEFLKENKFPFSDCSADKRGGMLRVRVKHNTY